MWRPLSKASSFIKLTAFVLSYEGTITLLRSSVKPRTMKSQLVGSDVRRYSQDTGSGDRWSGLGPDSEALSF